MYQHIFFEKTKVAYQVDGEKTKPCLVLLHGLCEDSTIWDAFIETLVADYFVLRPDLSGFGASDILPQHSIDLMADSVKAVIDAEKIKSCVLIGHSMGGYVSVAFAKKYASILRGVGLFHSHPYEDTDDRKNGRVKAIEFIRKNGHILYVKQLIPNLFADLFVSSNQFLINALILKATQYPAEAIIGAQEAMLKRDDNSVVLAALDIPVLFIIGKQDTVIPYDVSLQQTFLPKVADVHILPKVAHMGMFRAKEQTVGIVRRFMDLCIL